MGPRPGKVHYRGPTLPAKCAEKGGASDSSEFYILTERKKEASGGRPRQPKERDLEPNLRHAENVLQQTLGVKVQINDRQGKGKIVIECHSVDDYDRILAALGVKN